MNFELSRELEPAALRESLNGVLPRDIAVLSAAACPDGFHARFSARGKEYRYQIDCGAVADPFLRAFAWHHPSAKR